MKKTIYLLFIILSIHYISGLYAQESKPEWRPIKEINTDYHEFSPTISPDGKFMIFGSTRPGGLGDKDLYISYYNDGKWSAPQNMRALNSAFHDQEPFISYDGTALLFSSDRDGGFGVGDIVHRDYLNIVLFLGSPECQSSYPSKSINSDLYAHFISSLKYGLIRCFSDRKGVFKGVEYEQLYNVSKVCCLCGRGFRFDR